MVNDFLRKYQEELISEKIQLKEDLDLLDTKIKEETKFLTVLEESNDSYFKEFTPRNVNAKNNEKAAEVRNNLEDLKIQYDKKNENMKFYESRLVEINALLTNTAVVNKPNSNNEMVEQRPQSSAANDDLITKLNNVKSLILLDPQRAQIELENVISTL
ncbi:MAG: hypothetical protein K6E79_06780 [Pseudobutyrivibrio sp.]|nr:hypothetical protein [Pseudobutyrivibrio sp.]